MSWYCVNEYLLNITMYLRYLLDSVAVNADKRLEHYHFTMNASLFIYLKTLQCPFYDYLAMSLLWWLLIDKSVFIVPLGRSHLSLSLLTLQHSALLRSRACSLTIWAERDTAVNLYPLDVATTPFSATWRNDAIHCNIVSGTVRYGTGPQLS